MVWQDERMRRKVVRLAVVLLILLSVSALTGCTMLSEERIKLRDLDFTVLSQERTPEELLLIIADKKQMPFQITFRDKDNLYIVIGYGEQASGGYSIVVNELYLTDSAVYVNTSLLGPESSEKAEKVLTYPYIVIKTEGLDETVIFE